MKSVSKRNVYLRIIVYTLFIIGLKTAWWMFLQPVETLEVSEGEVFLKTNKFDVKTVYNLDGEWAFYPYELVRPNEINRFDKSFEVVPSNWDVALQNEDESTIGYGTYHLKIHLPENYTGDIGFYFYDVYTSAKIYVNNKLMGTKGFVSANSEDYVGNIQPFSVTYRPNSNEVNLLIQVSNYELPNYAGILKSVKFGSGQAITDFKNDFELIQIIMIILFYIHALYGLILFAMGNRKKEIVYFVLIAFASVITIMFDDSLIGLYGYELSLESTIKLKNIGYSLIPIFVLMTMKHLFSRSFDSKGIKSLIFLNVLVIALTIIIPLNYTIYMLFVSNILSLIIYFSIFYISIKNQFYDKKYYKLVIFLNLCLVSGTLSGIIFNVSNLEVAFYPFELIFVFMGLTVLLFKYIMDETEQIKELSQNLKQVNDLKKLFLNSISKELRIPIQQITNITNTLLGKKGNYDEQLELISIANRHMQITLNNLLDISQIYDNKLKLNKQPVALKSIVDLVIPIFNFAQVKRIDIRQKIPLSLSKLCADENRMIQILFILINNALHYLEQGWILIEAEEKDHAISISVSDNGSGITEEFIDDIFNPYINDPKSKGRRNTGIDLFICRQLVRIHGGELTVESEEDKGSKFNFTIPVYNANKEVLKEPSTIDHLITSFDEELFNANTGEHYQNQKHPKKNNEYARILLVDHNQMNLEVMSRILSDNNAVVTAISGEEAVEKIQSNTFDVVVSDVLIPDLSGFELTKRIRKRYTSYELPIILMSSSTIMNEKYIAFSVGANDFILKPVDMIELQSRINSFVMLKKSIKSRLDMEAAWLQAQIRPHFLFNTLSSIISLSYTDQEAMINLLNDLSTYLRMSFRSSNTDSVVPLVEELELVYAYLEIEKARFGDRVNVIISIDQSKELFIPPIALQTIVENAIRHGVLSKTEGGTLFITLEYGEDFAKLIVKDNGIGMDRVLIQNLLEGKMEGRTGIGISNTDERLKRLFGKGLSIESEPGNGTTITIYLPYKYMKKNI